MTALRDVLRFEELRTELQAIADDMAIRFARSSRSPVIREYLDFSTAICLPDGRIAAQGFSLPLHLGAVPRAVAAVLRPVPGRASAGRSRDPQRSVPRGHAPAGHLHGGAGVRVR